MKRINNAYETLSDQNKRYQYDTYEYRHNKNPGSHSAGSESKHQDDAKTYHKKQTNTD
jgi:DnaJ-class molecular chaperone